MFAGRFEGEPLKRVALAFDGARARGDVIVTKSGLEGGAIYALSAPLREAILQDGEAVLTIDLRPDMTAAELAARLGEAARQAIAGDVPAQGGEPARRRRSVCCTRRLPRRARGSPWTRPALRR